MGTIPAPDLPDVVVTRIDGVINGIDCANVIALRDLTGTATVLEVIGLFAASLEALLASSFGTDYRNVISNGRGWVNLHGVRYDAENPEVADEPLSGAVFAGLDAGDDLPPQVAVCCSLRTGLASRRFRGRLYDYGFTENDCGSDGRMTTETRDAVQTFWDELRDGINTSLEFQWGVLSRGYITDPDNPDDRPSYDQSFTPITTVAVRDQIFDTMRSRVT